jgi:hypothetical protein
MDELVRRTLVWLYAHRTAAQIVAFLALLPCLAFLPQHPDPTTSWLILGSAVVLFLLACILLVAWLLLRKFVIWLAQ